jgi:hypothetical protein
MATDWQTARTALQQELDRLTARARATIAALDDELTRARRRRHPQAHLACNADRLQAAHRVLQAVPMIERFIDGLPTSLIAAACDHTMRTLGLGRDGDDAVFDSWLAFEALEFRRQQAARASKLADINRALLANDRDRLLARAQKAHAANPALTVYGIAKVLDRTHPKAMHGKLLRLDLNWCRRRQKTKP